MDKVLEKVTAFVTRESNDGPQLLLFRHPHAGIQLPAGSVEEGESHLAAALREAEEETGLRELENKQFIGYMDTQLPQNQYVVLKKTKVYARPDHQSFDWAEFRRGITVECQRTEAGFRQVTYEEGDRYPDPTYITYRITGWVPSEVLAGHLRRYFYHITFTGKSADTWLNRIDCHLFQPFWAPLEDLPSLIVPQQEWLDYVTKVLSYQFG